MSFGVRIDSVVWRTVRPLRSAPFLFPGTWSELPRFGGGHKTVIWSRRNASGTREMTPCRRSMARGRPSIDASSRVSSSTGAAVAEALPSLPADSPCPGIPIPSRAM